ncbi:MAG: sterol desaturase family protein [Deltaproteobacteria bacterium]|nr:sterol desaturase family protein [Deltaproteobacteria bacterium]
MSSFHAKLSSNQRLGSRQAPKPASAFHGDEKRRLALVDVLMKFVGDDVDNLRITIELILREGSNRLFHLFSDPSNRVFWPALFVCVVVLIVVGQHFPKAIALSGTSFSSSFEKLHTPLRSLFSAEIWKHISTRVDVKLLLFGAFFKAALLSLSLFSVHAFTLKTLTFLEDVLGEPPTFSLSDDVVAIFLTLALFVTWDLSRFGVHVAMHRIPFLWRFHAVHHSAEVLTPLTLFRVHPVETLLVQIRGVLVTGALTGLFFYLWRRQAVQITLLGVNALTLLASYSLSNLRHSHVFLGFGKLERLFISPAQHQIHHGDDEKYFNKNFGTWLSCWDQMLGSFLSSSTGPPERFGVRGVKHPTLFSALRAASVDVDVESSQ